MPEYASHEEKVSILQGRLQKRCGVLCSSRRATASNTTRNRRYAAGLATLDLSTLDQILSIDVEAKTMDVEPGVSMESLFDATYRYGLMPKVVPEFRGITVGGAVMGAALESSSFRYGQFYDTCLGVEVLLGDGTLCWASPEEDSELFYALSGSYGTLGLVTRVKLSLVEAPRSIRLSYHVATTYGEALSFFQGLAKVASTAYLEGIVLSPSRIVLIAGTFSDAAPTLHLLRPLSCWYIQHIALRGEDPSCEDVLPVKDYLFRLDRGAFWMGCYAARWPLWRSWLSLWRLHTSAFADRLRRHLADHPPLLSPSWWKRLCLLPFVGARHLYGLWHRLDDDLVEELFVVQDFYVPEGRVVSFLTSVTSCARMFPLWLCPIRGTSSPQFLSPHYCLGSSDTYVNVGIYGHPCHIDGGRLTRMLEAVACEHGARKMLYARTYYDEATFWSIYDALRYQAMRERYRAEGAFLALYPKLSS